MKAILFDREQVDHLDDLPQQPDRLNGSKLLWVDVDRGSGESAEKITNVFELDDETCQRLASSSGRAHFHDYGRYMHMTTYSPTEEEDKDLIALECVVGKNWVITAHDHPVPVLQEFAERVSGSGDTGVLDGPAFLATLLEWVLGAYSSAFERVEERLEEFDVQAMRGEGKPEDDIERLVATRREVGVWAKTPRGSASSRCCDASKPPCRKHETPEKAPSAPSTCSSQEQAIARTTS